MLALPKSLCRKISRGSSIRRCPEPAGDVAAAKGGRQNSRRCLAAPAPSHHIYTVGRFRGEEDIIAPPENIPVLPTSRGGSITYHGPGQLVGYPILDLRANGLSVHKYIWKLEEVIIKLIAGFGIDAQRNDTYPGGVWVGGQKICSVGINVSCHITTHGFALNVNNDLKYFRYIRPCGMRGISMTSIAELLGFPVPFAAVVHNWIRLFSEIFELRRETNTMLSVEEATTV
ncbi:MAG: lipoyl(octanoyl) transferase LipB [Dehalococcoidia bacterium]|nr:lipoyl(octanoyl) transferase LipB [Dehalococcoidia bacterium]